MRQEFDSTLNARLTVDDADRVRGVLHAGELPERDDESPRAAAIAYVRELAPTLGLDEGELAEMHVPVSHLDPEDRPVQFRLSDEKTMFDATTVAFDQTHLNVPVWAAGITVTVKGNPPRVVSAVNSAIAGIEAKLPSPEAIDAWRALFLEAALERQERAFDREKRRAASRTARAVRDILGGRVPGGPSRGRVDKRMRGRVIQGRFFVYRYVADGRYAPGAGKGDLTTPLSAPPPYLDLPPVDDSIRDGADYLVAEVTFHQPIADWGALNWRALVEVETGSTLYLRALADTVDGLVFQHDPMTESGNAANGPGATTAVLNPFRDDVTLLNLNAPANGTQALQGSRASLTDIENPTVAAPTQPTGSDFDYDVRTNEFAAVNAYYHSDRFFGLVENLGFNLATYFNGTAFPMEVDHRGFGGNIINAHCIGNGMGGIDHCCYALAHTGDTANPISIGADWRVHLHEVGGHGILYEHVGGPNFGFSHSAGDSFAAILNDPESQLADRFETFPWVPAIGRRHDRTVGAGWAWGGTNDVGGYPSEEILCTTMFRIYRSIGGDAADRNRRRFAARVMAYLMLRAIGTLTPATNPNNALGFSNALQAVDLLNWTSEGLYGGAYNKVIRWSFEKQGLYQAAGAPTPVTTEGQPPAVDVYIDDGRAGEYQYQPVHWAATSIWNRRANDAGLTHEEPVLGQTNFAYCLVKNRGTQDATDVVVRAYHCRPSAGLLWPNDLQPMTTPQLSVGVVGPNSGDEHVVGPFEWTPVTNAYGHDCIIMIASNAADPSNVDHFTAGEVIPEWRLVPNDNNVAQRNVYPVAGGGGGEGLHASLDGRPLWIGNPNPRKAMITVDVHMPKFLGSDWGIQFKGIERNRFPLRPGEKRMLVVSPVYGGEFSAGDVEKAGEDRDIVITVRANDSIIGGMTYRLDPAIEWPFDPTRGYAEEPEKRDAAKKLLDTLAIGDKKVANVRVKRISLDIDTDE